MPREHGSWAVLIGPVLVGLAAAGGGSVVVIALFCAAVLGGFLLRVPLQSLISPSPARGAPAWAAGYAALAAAGAIPLLLAYERWGLLGFAAPAGALMAFNLHSNANRRAFSFSNEIMGILGLCLGAPAAFYAARGSLAGDAWLAWGLSALYFLGPIFDVKAEALRHRAAADTSALPALARMRETSFFYHAAAALVVCAASLAGWAPRIAPLPFLAALHKTRSRGRLPAGRVDFRTVGFQEVGYAVFFVLVVGLGFYLGF